MTKEEIRKNVREGYAEVARQRGSCCGPSASCCGSSTAVEKIAEKAGYEEEDMIVAPGRIESRARMRKPGRPCLPSTVRDRPRPWVGAWLRLFPCSPESRRNGTEVRVHCRLCVTGIRTRFFPGAIEGDPFPFPGRHRITGHVQILYASPG